MKICILNCNKYIAYFQINTYFYNLFAAIFCNNLYLNMSEEHQLPSDSDEDDEDYVPDGVDSDPVSEVESEGDIESGPEDENDENKRETGKKSAKRSKSRKNKKVKRRRTLEKSKVSEEKSKEEEECKEKKELTEEEEKKRADSLWADFMKDTGLYKIITQ